MVGLACLVAHLVGRGIAIGMLDHARVEIVERRAVVHVDVGRLDQRLLVPYLVIEDLALAGVGEHDEFMAQLAADRPGVGAHRNGFQPHPVEGARVGDQLAQIALAPARLVEIEAVGVLHQEFAPAHHAEARAHLVAKFPLHMIEHRGQVPVALHVVAEERSEHLFIGRPVEHLAPVAVGDAQHLGAVGVVAPAFLPQVGALDRRHEHFLPDAILLLANDPLDLLEHAVAERQPGVDAARGLPHQPCLQHQLVADDLGRRRAFLEDGHEGAGQAHGRWTFSAGNLAPRSTGARAG